MAGKTTQNNLRRSSPKSQCESTERQLEVLLTNNLVGNEREIAEAILSDGAYMPFYKGEKLIEEGGSDDCAYFILVGDVCFFVNGRNIGDCSAPRTVGELTANNPSKRRTADVTATTPIVETWKISGARFREIRDAFPSFKKRLDDMIEEMNREKIAQTGEINSKKQNWLWVSLSVGLAGALFSGLLAYQYNLDLSLMLCSIMAGAAVSFLLCAIFNPEYWYRRTAVGASFSLIGLILYGGISFSLTAGDESGKKWLLDFSNASELTVWHLLVGCFFLTFVIVVSIIADLKSRSLH